METRAAASETSGSSGSTESKDVKLLGQRFALKYPEKDAAVASEAVALVERRIKEAASRSRDPNPLNTAVLALLELAEEYVRARARTVEWQQQVTDKSTRILRLIDSTSGATSSMTTPAGGGRPGGGIAAEHVPDYVPAQSRHTTPDA